MYAFDPASDLTLDGGRLIPMFGITDLYRDVDFGDYGSYKNLRSHSLAEGLRQGGGEGRRRYSPRIKSVVLTRCNKGGFRAPQRDQQPESVCARGLAILTTLPLRRCLGPVCNGRKCGACRVGRRCVWTAYVPRVQDSGQGVRREPLGEDERARIVVVYDEKVEVEHFVDFKYYGDPPVYAPSASKGDYFNIVRKTTGTGSL